MWKRSLSCVLLLSGCSGGGASGTSSATSASASAKPSAAALASGSASAMGTSASSAAATGDFGLVLEGESVRVFPLRNAAFVDTGAFLAVLNDGPLVQDPDLTKTAYTEDGRPIVMNAMRFSDFWGSYPDQLIASGDTRSGIFGRVNDTWTDQNPLRDGERVLDVTPWENKRAIMAIRMAESDIRFVLVNSPGGVVLPGPGAAPQGQTDCNVPMDVDSSLVLAGLPSGELFGASRECKSGKAIAQFWKPKSTSAAPAYVDGVPDGAKAVAIAAVSPGEAYALYSKDATSFLATWDGASWKGKPSPFGPGTAETRSLGAGPDGSAWGIGEQGLFIHAKGGDWKKVELPGKVTGFWAKDDKIQWAVVDGKKLFRKGPTSGGPIKLPAKADVETALSRDKRWLATSVCKSVYVHLAAIGPSGGDPPKTFAGLTSAVKGNAALDKLPFIVEEVGPTQVVGAVVPSVDVANDLIAAFVKANEKAKPLVFCHRPIEKGKLSVE